MTYEVQIFKLITEGHLSKELTKRAQDGWRVASTCHVEKLGFVVTWEKPA
ncbi:MAG: hypothetical protein ACXVGC_09840 [Mycobacteriaceae bacterium]